MNILCHAFDRQTHAFAAQKYHRVLAGSHSCIGYDHGYRCPVGIIRGASKINAKVVEHRMLLSFLQKKPFSRKIG